LARGRRRAGLPSSPAWTTVDQPAQRLEHSGRQSRRLCASAALAGVPPAPACCSSPSRSASWSPPLDGRGGQLPVEDPRTRLQAREMPDGGASGRSCPAGRPPIRAGQPARSGRRSRWAAPSRSTPAAGRGRSRGPPGGRRAPGSPGPSAAGVHEVQVAQHDSRPLEAEDVEHGQSSSVDAGSSPPGPCTQSAPAGQARKGPAAGRSGTAGRPAVLMPRRPYSTSLRIFCSDSFLLRR